MNKKIINYILLLFFSCFASFLIYNHFDYKINVHEMDLSNISKIMIVAHPDDEILWGGAHLIEDNYLVVCITCGRNKTRVKEFDSVLKKTNDKYIMLGYPDKSFGKRNDWKENYKNIYSDLKEIISLKDWDLIVTHNKNGEYGHIHHKLTSRIVTDIVKDNNNKYKLYYFGKYYTKSKIKKVEETLPKITEDILKQKLDLINVYKSQDFIKKMFGHMNRYENWEKYYKEN